VTNARAFIAATGTWIVCVGACLGIAGCSFNDPWHIANPKADCRDHGGVRTGIVVYADEHGDEKLSITCVDGTTLPDYTGNQR
jgi:hypothetical protein